MTLALNSRDSADRAATRAPSLLKRNPTLRELTRPSLIIAIAFLVLVSLFAIFPEFFTDRDPYETDVTAKLLPPSSEHLFGTDALGRDQFARFIHGTRTTLIASFAALLIGFSVSIVLGLLSGYLGGIVDDIISRAIDVFLAVPGLLIALLLVTGLGFGSLNIAIAVGVSSVAGFTRLLRAEVLRVKQLDFVIAAKQSGARWYDILRRHVLPHSISPIIALSALEFGGAVLAISALSFLGFGAQAPTPEWGSMVANGRDFLQIAPWLTLLPALSILVVVLSANRISKYFEGVR